MREGRARAPWTRGVNINQLLADLFDALEPQALARNVRLVPDFQGVAILDWGVPPDLVFAFENLIENAIKYSEEGGEVRTLLRLRDGSVSVEVQDRGIGIPEELLQDVLHEFVRAPNAKKHAPQGTGLGLAIAREAIETHGGTLELMCREGGGTIAEVLLPLQVKAAVMVSDESGKIREISG
jgi:two-component system sensor histidine kinase ResE